MRIIKSVAMFNVIFYTSSLTLAKARKQAKTVAQLKDFVGKLGGLQSEHHALTLRMSISQYFENVGLNFPRHRLIRAVGSHYSDRFV